VFPPEISGAKNGKVFSAGNFRRQKTENHFRRKKSKGVCGRVKTNKRKRDLLEAKLRAD
jgi:hypothetical protein